MKYMTATRRRDDLKATAGTAPAPLGEYPSAEEILDVAVEYTFPASDPTAVGAVCNAAREEAKQSPAEGRDALPSPPPKQGPLFPLGPGG
jgi:hypothetical protein